MTRPLLNRPLVLALLLALCVSGRIPSASAQSAAAQRLQEQRRALGIERPALHEAQWPVKRPPESPKTPPAEAVGELEALLQRVKFPYTRVQLPDTTAPMFEVSVAAEGGPAVSTLAIEFELQTNGREKLVVLLTPLGQGTADQKLEVLEKIAAINSTMPVGKVGAGGDGRVIYRSEFWLRTGDPEILRNHLQISFAAAQVLPQDLGLAADVQAAAPAKEQGDKDRPAAGELPRRLFSRAASSALFERNLLRALQSRPKGSEPAADAGPDSGGAAAESGHRRECRCAEGCRCMNDHGSHGAHSADGGCSNCQCGKRE